MAGLQKSKQVTQKAFPDTINGYTMVKFLGRGSMGEVFLVTHDETEYTMKVSTNSKEHTFWQKNTIQMSGIPKTHIVFADKCAYVIITEYAKGECLFDVIEELTCGERTTVMVKLIRLLARLHLNGFAHLDVKLENLIFDRTNQKLWLIDFDEAISKKTPQVSLCGSPMYVAPDLWLLKGIVVVDWNLAMAADTWSIMTCCYMLITGYPPFTQSMKNHKFATVFKGCPLFSAHAKWFAIVVDFLRKQHWVDRKCLDDLFAQYGLISKSIKSTRSTTPVRQTIKKQCNSKK